MRGVVAQCAHRFQFKSNEVRRHRRHKIFPSFLLLALITSSPPPAPAVLAGRRRRKQVNSKAVQFAACRHDLPPPSVRVHVQAVLVLLVGLNNKLVGPFRLCPTTSSRGESPHDAGNRTRLL